MYDFFRKEREAVFHSRFFPQPLRDGSKVPRLSSNVIFQAKNTGSKQFTVTTKEREQIALECSVEGGCVLLIKERGRHASREVRLTEEDMATLLASKPAQPGWQYLAVRQLCKDHAACSSSSPLISGCVVNNFHANTKFDGYKLHLTLRTRKPFRNPDASGNEAEHFLIGQVLSTDCTAVQFLGWSKSGQDVERRMHVCRIPTVPENYTPRAAGPGQATSRIPRPV